MSLGAGGNHTLNTIWEDIVAPKVHICLNEMGVKWTDTFIARFTEFGEPPRPASLLIGVKPKSLADEDANAAAYRCLDILKEFDITDIGVEIGESISWQ